MYAKILLVQALLGMGCCGLFAQSVGRVVEGDTLPSFVVRLHDGTSFDTSQPRESPLLLAFFHTKCLDCRRELPVLQQLYEQYGEKLELLCISRAEEEDAVKAYWQREQLTLPYSAQSDKRIFHLFADRGIPRIYLFDTSGKVVAAFREKVSRRKLERAVRRVLQHP